MTTFRVRLQDLFSGDKGKLSGSQARLLKKEPPSVINIIEHVLEMKREEPKFVRPSMLWGCERANYAHYTQVRPAPEQARPRLRRILDVGTMMHELYIGSPGYLSDHPDVWFVPESKVAVEVEGLLIRGSGDGLLIRRADLYRWGFELKTISNSQFEKMTKPKPAHVRQVRIYQRLQKVWWYTIVYVNKDTQHMREFHVEYSPKEWKNFRTWMRTLKQYIDDGEIPAFDADTCNPDLCRVKRWCKKHGGDPDSVNTFGVI